MTPIPPGIRLNEPRLRCCQFHSLSPLDQPPLPHLRLWRLTLLLDEINAHKWSPHNVKCDRNPALLFRAKKGPLPQSRGQMRCRWLLNTAFATYPTRGAL